tara:strand:- start:1629 stop:2303 length:675 start_codon:yes stop_codon:yes gene_type:complete
LKNITTLYSEDGHKLDAYFTTSDNNNQSALVVLQEIFGVNEHIKSVCDRIASDGFTCISPALFDRKEAKVALNYHAKDIEKGRELRAEVGWDLAMLDINASIDFLRNKGFEKIGVIGYCWGGSLAFLAASRCNINASVGYYGGQIMEFIEELPKCPLMLHFGAEDASIPITNVQSISNKHPNILTYIYKNAGHGFNCDQRADFNQIASRQAYTRTLDHFHNHIL